MHGDDCLIADHTADYHAALPPYLFICVVEIIA